MMGTTVSQWVAVGAGGLIGTLGRFALSLILLKPTAGATFPWTILTINLLGCFMIGIAWGIMGEQPSSSLLLLFVFTGVLGAFTTFSTIGLETFQLLFTGKGKVALCYVLVTNIAGVSLVGIGVYFYKYLKHIL